MNCAQTNANPIRSSKIVLTVLIVLPHGTLPHTISGISTSILPRVLTKLFTHFFPIFFLWSSNMFFRFSTGHGSSTRFFLDENLPPLSPSTSHVNPSTLLLHVDPSPLLFHFNTFWESGSQPPFLLSGVQDFSLFLRGPNFFHFVPVYLGRFPKENTSRPRCLVYHWLFKSFRFGLLTSCYLSQIFLSMSSPMFCLLDPLIPVWPKS